MEQTVGCGIVYALTPSVTQFAARHAVRCWAIVRHAERSTATVIAITAKNGPSTRANIRVRLWDGCETLIVVLH